MELNSSFSWLILIKIQSRKFQSILIFLRIFWNKPFKISGSSFPIALQDPEPWKHPWAPTLVFFQPEQASAVVRHSHRFLNWSQDPHILPLSVSEKEKMHRKKRRAARKIQANQIFSESVLFLIIMSIKHLKRPWYGQLATSYCRTLSAIKAKTKTLYEKYSLYGSVIRINNEHPDSP